MATPTDERWSVLAGRLSKSSFEAAAGPTKFQFGVKILLHLAAY